MYIYIYISALLSVLCVSLFWWHITVLLWCHGCDITVGIVSFLGFLHLCFVDIHVFLLSRVGCCTSANCWSWSLWQGLLFSSVSYLISLHSLFWLCRDGPSGVLYVTTSCHYSPVFYICYQMSLLHCFSQSSLGVTAGWTLVAGHVHRHVNCCHWCGLGQCVHC